MLSASKQSLLAVGCSSLLPGTVNTTSRQMDLHIRELDISRHLDSHLTCVDVLKDTQSQLALDGLEGSPYDQAQEADCQFVSHLEADW
jgi:hypothetical protein